MKFFTLPFFKTNGQTKSIYPHTFVTKSHSCIIHNFLIYAMAYIVGETKIRDIDVKKVKNANKIIDGLILKLKMSHL